MTASDGDVYRGDETCHSLQKKREHSLALLLSIAKRSKLYVYLLSSTKFVEIVTIREWDVDTTVYHHHPRQVLNLENWGFWHGRIPHCLL